MPEFEIPTPILDDVRATLVAERRDSGSVSRYVQELDKTYRDRRWANILQGFSDIIEPTFPIPVDEGRKPSATEFFHGGLLGMRVVEHARGHKFLGYVIASILENTKGFDPYEPEDEEVDDLIRHADTAKVVLGLADEGLASADPNLQLIERWSTVLAPDDASRQYFSTAGFGFILYVSHEIIKVEADLEYGYDMEQFVQEANAAASGDWDAAFRELA